MTATLEQLASALRAGSLSSRALVEQCLARALDPSGEGARTFLHVDTENARRAADAVDAARRAGNESRPFAGIPVSVKDLFDVAGQVTTAGSVVLKDAAPATQDAEAVRRLKTASFVVVGRTNMTEFAYSGLGLNPHYGLRPMPSTGGKGAFPAAPHPARPSRSPTEWLRARSAPTLAGRAASPRR